MSRFLNRKSVIFVLVALALIAGFFGTVVLRGGAAPSRASAPKSNASMAKATDKASFCAQVNHSIAVSSGAMMYCNGSQPHGNSSAASKSKSKKNSFGSNVDAANPTEDVTPNGTQVYGQSETSVAATGRYVVEQWNDATSFFSPPCSPNYEDQGSGWGFSSNSGKSFTDEGGLPNTFCATSFWSGDPSVEVWNTGGTTYFYQSSLFETTTANVETCGAGSLCAAVTACTVSGNNISCNATPVTLASVPGGTNFEDKDFMSIDPVHGVLYVDFTDFEGPSGDDIALWECNIGADPGLTSETDCNGPLYVASSNGCENEGAYPAADLATGDVYVAYEHNWATNLLEPACYTDPIQNRINYITSACTLPAATFPANPGCTGEDTYPLAFVNINSLDAQCIPGYNRTLCTTNPPSFPNDFPRIAVSDPAGTVSIVWNDTRYHPLGDILLQSFDLSSLFPTPVQSTPTRINSATGGLHLFPAMRNVDAHGKLQITFYQRATGNTALTDVYGAFGVSPLATKTPKNIKVTTGPSDWNAVSSDIIPNFGDYTDNYVIATKSAPYTGQTLSVAWSDGRLGYPNPFYASVHTS
jgi:hypothetical protein